MAKTTITNVDWNKITLFINNRVLINNINVLKENGYLKIRDLKELKDIPSSVKTKLSKEDLKQLNEIHHKATLAKKINEVLINAKLCENEFLKTWDAEHQEKLERLADNINMINNQFIQLELKDREELTIIIDKFYTDKMKEYDNNI